MITETDFEKSLTFQYLNTPEKAYCLFDAEHNNIATINLDGKSYVIACESEMDMLNIKSSYIQVQALKNYQWKKVIFQTIRDWAFQGTMEGVVYVTSNSTLFYGPLNCTCTQNDVSSKSYSRRS